MASKGWSFGALTAALKAVAFWAPVDLYKAVYPVGIVVMFDNNTNPNTAYPGTTWIQVTNGKTVRAAPTPAQVGTEGGSDSISLISSNLPSHTHIWSGTISNTDLGTKTSSGASANHTHNVSGTSASAGAHVHGGKYRNSNPSYNGGSSSSRAWNIGDGYSTADAMIQSSGAHTHALTGTAASAGAHTHTVLIGTHNHAVNGSVASTGSGTAVDVTNAYHMYGMWKRTA